MEVGGIAAGADSGRHWVVIFGRMVAKLKAFVTLDAGVEAEVGDPDTTPKM